MKNKTALNIILFISIFVLISAYFVEYILGYKPCNLCLIERLPYFFSIIIILLCLTINKFYKIVFILLTITFAVGTILSFYHFGIEQGFFKESLVCAANNEINSLAKEDLIKELQKKAFNSSKHHMSIPPLICSARLVKMTKNEKTVFFFCTGTCHFWKK